MGRRPRADRGFTLIEVIVVVTVLGLVAVAIAGAFSVIARTSPANQDRADDARALLNLTRWLPDDVASTYTYPYDVTPVASNGFTTDGSAPRCTSESSLPHGGSSLLNLTWSEGNSSYFVDYFWVRDGDTIDGRHQGRIARFSCFGTSSGPTSATEELNMTDRLGELPGDLVPAEVSPIEPPFLNDGSSSIVGGVNFAVRVFDDRTNSVRDILELVAVSKNVQGQELGATAGGGTGVQPNHEPPVASDLLLQMHAGTEQTFDLPVYDYDGTLERLRITLDVTGVPGWTATATVNSPDPQVTIASDPLALPGLYSIPYIVQDRDGEDGAKQDEGVIEVTIVEATQTLADPVTVLPPPPPPPCVTDFATAALTPDPVSLRKANNNPDNDVNVLASSIEVAITRSGACDPLFLRFAPDPQGAEVLKAFNNSTDLTIHKNDYSWRIGDRTLELVELTAAGPVVHDTTILTVSPAS